MADTKISALSDGGAGQTTDEFVIARGDANYKLTGANLAGALGGSRPFTQLSDASQSPQLSVHQGYTTDGTNHYTTDTAKIQKRNNDGTWSVAVENTSPFTGVSSVDHLGDCAYDSGSIYVPMSFYNGIGTGDFEHIAVFDASTLDRTDAVDITGIATRTKHIAGVCVVGSYVYSVDFADGSKIWQFNKSDLSFVGTITLSATLSYLQGISYYDGVFYLSSNWGQVYAVDTSGVVLGVVATGLPDQATAVSHEGIDATQGDGVRWLIDQGATSRYVHYFTTTESLDATLSKHGQETYGDASPVSTVVLPGSGVGSGVMFGEDPTTAPALWKSNTGTKILRLIRSLNLLCDQTTPGGTFLSATVTDVNGQPTSTPVVSIDYDTTVGLRMGPKGGASARDVALTRDTLGARFKIPQQLQVVNGVATYSGDLSGKTSAAIDALFTPTPVDGTVLVDTGNTAFWVRVSGIWCPQFLMGTNATAGDETMPRDAISVSGAQIATGQLRLAYFTAKRSETITQIITPCGGNVSGTPTLIRYGLYSVASNGDLTLVASTASDTSLLAVAGTDYPKALSTNYDKVAGQRYALGVIQVGATNVSVLGQSTSNSATLNARSPRVSALLSGQTDLPSTIATGSLSTSSLRLYAIAAP